MCSNEIFDLPERATRSDVIRIEKRFGSERAIKDYVLSNDSFADAVDDVAYGERTAKSVKETGWIGRD